MKKEKKIKPPIEISFSDLKENVDMATAGSIRSGTEWGKTISIRDLPECNHKRMLINAVQSIDAKICVIAVKHQLRWEAYAGYPDVKELKPMAGREVYSTLEWNCENIRTAKDVRMLGDVLPSDIAHILFPDWDIELYSHSPALSKAPAKINRRVSSKRTNERTNKKSPKPVHKKK